jgi:adenosylcobinamide amidohydrolase
MCVKIIIIILLLIILFHIFLGNVLVKEGYMSVRPSFNMIINKNFNSKFSPVNTFLKNFNVKQDFDSDSVFTQVK